MNNTLINLFNEYVNTFESKVVGTPAESVFKSYVKKITAVIDLDSKFITEVTVKLMPEIIANTEKEIA